MKQQSLKLMQKMNRFCCFSGISLIILISFFLISFFPLFFYLFIWFVIVLTFLSATKKNNTVISLSMTVILASLSHISPNAYGSQALAEQLRVSIYFVYTVIGLP